MSDFWLYRVCRVMGTSYFLTRQLILQNICAVSAFEAWLQSGQCFFYAFEETRFFSTKDLGVLCGMQKWKIKVADMIWIWDSEESIHLWWIGKPDEGGSRERHLLQFIPEEKNCLVGGLQSADFFRGDNKEGIDARNEVCMLQPSSVFICSRIGCQIGCQLHQTLNSKPHKRILETYHDNHQSYLAPFCVCVCVCVCAFSHLHLCKKLVSPHIMCRLQFLLWRTCFCGWRREDRLVLFFFNPFWTGVAVFLPKKKIRSAILETWWAIWFWSIYQCRGSIS